jgi:rod shape-determining protein MreB
MNIGTCFDRETLEMDVRGRNLVTGLPRTITVTSDEMREALMEPVLQIIDEVCMVLEKTPPELASDIADRGIVMTGGSSLLYGLDQLLMSKTGINVFVADEAVTSVAVGTGRYIEFMTSSKGHELIKQSHAADLRRY